MITLDSVGVRAIPDTAVAAERGQGARRAASVGAAGERVGAYPFVVDLRGVDQFRDLTRLLEKRGYRSEHIEKILGRSFLDYADRVWSS